MGKISQTTAAQLEFVSVTPSVPTAWAITAPTDTAKETAAKGIGKSGKYLACKFTDISSLVRA